MLLVAGSRFPPPRLSVVCRALVKFLWFEKVGGQESLSVRDASFLLGVVSLICGLCAWLLAVRSKLLAPRIQNLLTREDEL